jgi:hypothetical protein
MQILKAVAMGVVACGIFFGQIGPTNPAIKTQAGSRRERGSSAGLRCCLELRGGGAEMTPVKSKFKFPPMPE